MTHIDGEKTGSRVMCALTGYIRFRGLSLECTSAVLGTLHPSRSYLDSFSIVHWETARCHTWHFIVCFSSAKRVPRDNNSFCRTACVPIFPVLICNFHCVCSRSSCLDRGFVNILCKGPYEIISGFQAASHLCYCSVAAVGESAQTTWYGCAPVKLCLQSSGENKKGREMGPMVHGLWPVNLGSKLGWFHSPFACSTACFFLPGLSQILVAWTMIRLQSSVTAGNEVHCWYWWWLGLSYWLFCCKLLYQNEY